MKNDPQIAKLLEQGIVAPSPIGNTYVVNPQSDTNVINLMAHLIKRTAAAAENQSAITTRSSMVNGLTTSTILDSTTVMPKHSMMSKTTDVIMGNQVGESVVPLPIRKNLVEPISPAPTSAPIHMSGKDLKGSSYAAPSLNTAPTEMLVRRAEKKLVSLGMHTLPLADAKPMDIPIATVAAPSLMAMATTPATGDQTMMKEVTDLTNLPQLFGLLLKNQNTEGMNFERLLLMKTLVGLVRTMGMLQDFIVEARKTTTVAPPTTTMSTTTTTTVPTTTTTTTTAATTAAATTVTEPKNTAALTTASTTLFERLITAATRIPPPPPTTVGTSSQQNTLPSMPNIAADAKTEERWDKVMSFVHNYVAGMI